jgi:hypothetical protein
MSEVSIFSSVKRCLSFEFSYIYVWLLTVYAFISDVQWVDFVD